MALFGYKAIDKAGNEVKGSVEAPSVEEAKQDLRRQGLMIISVTKQNFWTKELKLNVGKPPTPRDLSVMCRQFVSMSKAGVSILDALRMLADQTENTRLREALKDVRINVEKGETLTESLRKHPNIFPKLMIDMVSAGEASGSLDNAIERMAIQFERTSKTQSLVKKAMVYPIAVCIVAVIVTVIMLVVVLPTYEEMFAEIGGELPLITRIYVGLSHGLIDYWYFVIAALVLAFFGIRKFSRTNLGQHIFHKIVLQIPIARNLVVKSASSLMARTLRTLLSAGVPLIEAVDIVSGVMQNVYFKEALQNAKEEIIIGMPLSRPLEESKLFPPMVYHMIRIGEEAGNTEEMLEKLADYYDEEVELAVQALMAALEPMIIVVLAIVVGGLVAACMSPMMEMYDALDTM